MGSLALDVEFVVAPDGADGGGPLVVVGPNGAGKSSLLLALLGALPIERGRVEVGGHVLVDTARGVRVPIEERRLGYVPQDYGLFPHLTVGENVAFVARRGPARERPESEREATRLVAELGLAHLAGRRPLTLSGGEKQRVALARALAARPRALLLDEPLAALDVRSRGEVRAFLCETLRALGLPSIVVTHEPADARALGGQVLVLEGGKVTQRGAWSDLVRAPATAFVEALTRAE